MKDMTGIFKEIHSNRRQAIQARMTWGVYSHTKAGTLYKIPTLTCIDESSAQAKVQELMQLNPSRLYSAKALSQ